MAQALQGIRIIEWAQFINGPGAGCMLSDLGADVIKIEHPVRGDAARGIASLFGSAVALPGGRAMGFECFNRNKRSITLDLSQPEGRELLYRMVEKMDVFLTNFAPSVSTKLGADYATLRKHNPKIIYARTSASGSRGPDNEIRAFDFIGQALSGMMPHMGERESAPGVMVGSPTDVLGSMMLAYGITVALLARERLGIGQEVDTSMVGAAMQMQALALAYNLFRDHGLTRHSRTKTKAPFSNYYQCSDGRWIMLSEIQIDRFWPKLCRALGIESLENDPKFNTMNGRRENAGEMIGTLTRVLATKPVDEWVNILAKDVGIACCRINSIADLVNDPKILANEYIVNFDHPTMGHIKAPGFPVYFSETPARIKSAAPEFGQHTEEVLREVAGCSWEALADLREKGAI